MASGDNTFNASETKGQAEEKTGQMTENLKQKAQDAKDKASQTKDQTSGSFISNKTVAASDNANGMAQTPMDKAMGAVQAIQDQASEMAESGKATTTASKDKAGSNLQQTSEQVKSMAQGAAEAVKKTFGMAGDDTTTAHEDNPNLVDNNKMND